MKTSVNNNSVQSIKLVLKINKQNSAGNQSVCHSRKKINIFLQNNSQLCSCMFGDEVTVAGYLYLNRLENKNLVSSCSNFFMFMNILIKETSWGQ